MPLRAYQRNQPPWWPGPACVSARPRDTWGRRLNCFGDIFGVLRSSTAPHHASPYRRPAAPRARPISRCERPRTPTSVRSGPVLTSDHGRRPYSVRPAGTGRRQLPPCAGRRNPPHGKHHQRSRSADEPTVRGSPRGYAPGARKELGFRWVGIACRRLDGGATMLPARLGLPFGGRRAWIPLGLRVRPPDPDIAVVVTGDEGAGRQGDRCDARSGNHAPREGAASDSGRLRCLTRGAAGPDREDVGVRCHGLLRWGQGRYRGRETLGMRKDRRMRPLLGRRPSPRRTPRPSPGHPAVAVRARLLPATLLVPSDPPRRHPPW